MREKARPQTHAWGGALHLDHARPKACTSDLGLDNAVSCPAGDSEVMTPIPTILSLHSHATDGFQMGPEPCGSSVSRSRVTAEFPERVPQARGKSPPSWPDGTLFLDLYLQSISSGIGKHALGQRGPQIQQ